MNNTSLYTRVTSNLAARIVQHNKNYHNGFSSKYKCAKLVYYNKWFDTIIEAITEEKRIKGGSRKKKEILINSMNPE